MKADVDSRYTAKRIENLMSLPEGLIIKRVKILFYLRALLSPPGSIEKNISSKKLLLLKEY